MIPCDKLLLNTKEAAKLLGVSNKMVLKWVHEEKIPCLPWSRKVLIPRRPLEQLIASKTLETILIESREG